MGSNYRSASVREQKVFENIEKARALHDEKLNKSNVNFKNTRVTSCSGVLMKNGKAVAMTFKQPAKCYQKEGDPLRSSETRSIAAYVSNIFIYFPKDICSYHFYSEMFKPRMTLHAGMARKPLEPYNPNATRSRLPQPTIVMPYKNSSQIIIGDRR